MSKIPELLTSLSGTPITTREAWERYRREEVLHLCTRYVYGERDIERPKDLHFRVVNTSEVFGMRCREIRAGFGAFSFPFYLYLPLHVEAPVPAFIYVMHENLENTFAFDGEGNMRSETTESDLPIKMLVDRGYAVALMPTREIYREWTTHSEFKVGVFAEVGNCDRTKYSWASVSAWAWGVSRVMDYLELAPEVNERRVASVGHSRSGKAALWAAATDERILLAIPNNTGCMGAAILRGKRGEHAKDINVSDWFCEKFREFNDCEELLPMDQHMVLSLIAPRYLYVTGSVLDEWADPDAELLAARLASPVWELYGRQGLLMEDEKPILNKPYQRGSIAFHVKEGDHSQTLFDWEQTVRYFDAIIEKEENDAML